MNYTRLFYLCLMLTALMISAAVPSSFAQTQRANIPQFTMTVGWDVSPTEMAEVRGLEALKLPCIMKAGFNNGFVLRFSGGRQNIMAMAIDFRQRVFTRDQSYQARINIDGTGTRVVNADAFSESVLIFDLKTLPNLYRELYNAKKLGLEVEGNRMVFALGNMQQSLNELEQCYAGSSQPMMASAAKPQFPSTMMKARSTPLTSSQPAPDYYSSNDLSRPRISRPIMDEYADERMPTGGQASETVKSMREPRYAIAPQEVRPPMVSQERRTLEMPPTMTSTMSEPVLSSPVGVTPRRVRPPQTSAPIDLRSSSAQASNVWNANAGDDMKTVLERWASRAGVDLQWQASNNGKVARDVSVSGTFEEAVQTLMAQNAAALGLEADMQTQSAAPVSSDVASRWQASMGSSKWVAASGASLRETLQRWSLDEGTAFLWKAGKEYKVKEPVQSNGSYEEALQQLLNQYADDTMRPAAELNIDPSGGGKLLTIE